MDNTRGGYFDEWTLFAMPKGFEGVDGIRQRNALTSWLFLEGIYEIILLGDDPGVKEFAEEMDMRHIPGVEVDECETPLISSIFGMGQQYAKTDIVCYANSDVILLNMGKAIAIVNDKFPEQFLCVGRRMDIDLNEPMKFYLGWRHPFARYAIEEGVRHSAGAVDYFAFRRGLYGFIPPFVIGRSSWDNWLVSVARDCGVPIIDLTPSVWAIHQDKPRPGLKLHTNKWWAQHKKNRVLYDVYKGKRGASSSRHAEWILRRGVLTRR